MVKVYKEEFELKDIPFADKKLEIEIKLYVKGMMEFMSDADGEGITYIKGKLSVFVMSAISMFAQEGCEYEAIHRRPILPVMVELLNEAGDLEPSFEIKNIYFIEIHPVDEDYKKIIEARKRIKLKETTVSSVNESATAASESTNINQTDTWTCPKCGESARGQFCSSCGTHKSILDNDNNISSNQPDHRRLCPSCGSNLTDRPIRIKFCPKCGKMLSAGVSNKVLDEIKIKFANDEYGKVQAIKYYRDQTGASLSEAKKAVEQVLEKSLI